MLFPFTRFMREGVLIYAFTGGRLGACVCQYVGSTPVLRQQQLGITETSVLPGHLLIIYEALCTAFHTLV